MRRLVQFIAAAVLEVINIQGASERVTNTLPVLSPPIINANLRNARHRICRRRDYGLTCLKTLSSFFSLSTLCELCGYDYYSVREKREF